jgi:DNA polymerase III subunit delta'
MIFTWHEPAWAGWNRLREKLPHAILVRGGAGTGVFEFAQSAAQALLCETPAAGRKACGKCPACAWFVQGNHPDYRLIVPESMAAETQEEGAEPAKKEKRSEQIRIEQVRELADFLAVGTHRAGLRVILAYPAEAMNANTQNALLKSLEEPPPSTVFLLAATQPDRLLATVRSRCRNFTLPFPDPARAVPWLKEQGVARPEAALAAVGGAPLAAVKAAESESDHARFIEGIRDARFDPITLAERMLKIPLPEVVGWLQRYHVGQEKAMVEASGRCEAADIAAYLRRLARARALAQHPLNAKLFVEDLLLQYLRLVGRA